MLTHLICVKREGVVMFEGTGNAVTVAMACQGFDALPSITEESERLAILLNLGLHETYLIPDSDPPNPSYAIIITRFAESARELSDD